MNHCTLSDISLDITGEDAAPIIKAVSDYLKTFTAPGQCAGCGATLAGFLGSFAWGLESGEGTCSGCGWPARGHHNITDDDGPVFTQAIEMVLSYHPDSVVSEPVT